MRPVEAVLRVEGDKENDGVDNYLRHKSVETFLRRVEEYKENDRGGESKICCNHSCKCPKVYPVQQYVTEK
jgi:hypothetical protein